MLGLVGFGQALWQLLSGLFRHPTAFFAFLGGNAAFLLIWFIYLSRREGFWSTLEHELTHALFAVLFLKKIRSLSASRHRGGTVTIEGGNAMIALAPYFFPLGALLVLLIKPLVQSQYQMYLNILLGFFYCFHLVHLFREFHPGQPDIQMSGRIFSFLFVAFMNLFFLGIILSMLPENGTVTLQFLKSGTAQTFELARKVYLRTLAVTGWQP